MQEPIKWEDQIRGLEAGGLYGCAEGESNSDSTPDSTPDSTSDSTAVRDYDTAVPTPIAAEAGASTLINTDASHSSHPQRNRISRPPPNP